jgi:hypothetical protein
MTPEEHQEEICRLHRFTFQLAARLAAASEVLTKLAERKHTRAVETEGDEEEAR